MSLHQDCLFDKKRSKILNIKVDRGNDRKSLRGTVKKFKIAGYNEKEISSMLTKNYQIFTQMWGKRLYQCNVNQIF